MPQSGTRGLLFLLDYRYRSVFRKAHNDLESPNPLYFKMGLNSQNNRINSKYSLLSVSCLFSEVITIHEKARKNLFFLQISYYFVSDFSGVWMYIAY